ncbi:MAG TPA: HD domain-containing phosphohydrolase, partial [Candidatus Saccharimonadales bacterium]|nr:HD domain-containing phosphohydrolase [Candidatus Saccharimonadales bacterium]
MSVDQERREAERRGAAKLATLLQVTRRLMTVTDLDALLRIIAEATTEMVDAERATIYIVDADRDEYWSKVALGVGTGEIRFPLGVGIAGTVARTGETINIADPYADNRFNPENDRRTGFRTHNLLTMPMTAHDGQIIGVFQAVNKRSGVFTGEDEATLGSLAALAAVAVENAQLVNGQRQLWRSLIETLARTVDARDQQTAGHSKRVTRYALVIGGAMGLDAQALEALEAAALLHDYGKIAVRDRFLQKPGKLDDAEFAYMKAHVEKTREFLAHLAFPRELRDVPTIAAQHHERMDGHGYPLGLSADQIVPGARIVARITSAFNGETRVPVLKELMLNLNNQFVISNQFIGSIIPSMSGNIQITDDYSLFAYKDKDGVWPGVIFELNEGAAFSGASMQVATDFPKNLFAADPGAAKGTAFKDGAKPSIAFDFVKYLQYSAPGASFNIGTFSMNGNK